MKLEYRDDLLLASLTLAHGGRAVTVNHVIVDTGAAQTIIDIIAVEMPQIFCRTMKIARLCSD